MARPKRKINPLLPCNTLNTPLTPSPHIYRTACYVRLSVEDSGKLGADTIAIQKALIQNYIANQPDMQLSGIYCDNGETGTHFERPGFERLIEDVKTGKIDCIVVKDLSRFGRNYRETGNYLERIFPFLNVRFVAVNDHVDTITSEYTNDAYLIPLRNIINEAYSKDISRKTASALFIKQQKGEFIGSWAPYGYRKCKDNPHLLEPEKETAPIVQKIFKWRLSGASYIQIAQKLNEQEIPSPARYHYLKGDAKSQRYANAVWKAPTVKKILSSEIYLGHMVQGCRRQSFYEGQKQQILPQSEWIIVPDTHEPIIDEEIFWAVQKIAEVRNRKKESSL